MVNLAIQQDLTPADENHFLIKLIEQFEEMLNLDLFKQSMAELDDLMAYWENMKKYAENLETSSSVA
ncbi:hypothetical protein FC65_GL000410 [Ligilactobacillus acidipiscis DSM 15836]|uniref:Antitoxin epsilon/PezA domain-containing protein n=1 Tax=Ligilactobacillus acidipiscis DSM 15836 TaxID=1423716 RepID=A0ABR5PIY2_9LACO|nr:hypothetical protein FC65_GL000410 [Ligilactobacillus acidipiscis DSM 15836]